VTSASALLHADELRLGLHGQVRRVLAPRGVKVVQPVQIEYRWRYLLLGVEPRTGALRWRWLERFRQDRLQPVLADWAPDAIIWDGAGAHRGKQLGDLPTARIFLPPYSPELNPAERVLEEIRRRVEGRVYDSLDVKQAEVDAYLQELAADPARVKRLCGWDWILAALQALPGADAHDDRK
jgi:transposase